MRNYRILAILSNYSDLKYKIDDLEYNLNIKGQNSIYERINLSSKKTSDIILELVEYRDALENKLASKIIKDKVETNLEQKNITALKVEVVQNENISNIKTSVLQLAKSLLLRCLGESIIVKLKKLKRIKLFST